MASALLTQLTRRRRQLETLQKNLELLAIIAGELEKMLDVDPTNTDAARELELVAVRRDRIQKSLSEAQSASSSR